MRGLFHALLLLPVAAGQTSPAAAQATGPGQSVAAPGPVAPISDPKLLSAQPRRIKGSTPDMLPLVQKLEREGRSGSVRASAMIMPEGHLTDILLVEPSGVPDLDAAILEALGGWRMLPARDLDGKQVATKASFPFFIGLAPTRSAGRDPELSPAAKDAGVNGKLFVTGVIDTSGNLKDVAITPSDAPAMLKEAITDALPAWTFQTPRNLKGEPYDRPVRYEFVLSQAQAGTGSYMAGFRLYRCAAFTKEVDWWTSVNPGKDFAEFEFAKFMAGLWLIAPDAVGAGGKVAAGDMRGIYQAHRQAWERARSGCRAHPDSTFLKQYSGR